MSLSSDTQSLPKRLSNALIGRFVEGGIYAGTRKRGGRHWNQFYDRTFFTGSDDADAVPIENSFYEHVCALNKMEKWRGYDIFKCEIEKGHCQSYEKELNQAFETGKIAGKWFILSYEDVKGVNLDKEQFYEYAQPNNLFKLINTRKSKHLFFYVNKVLTSTFCTKRGPNHSNIGQELYIDLYWSLDAWGCGHVEKGNIYLARVVEIQAEAELQKGSVRLMIQQAFRNCTKSNNPQKQGRRTSKQGLWALKN